MINTAPLIHRQLWISSRRSSTYHSRCLVVGVCIVIVVVELLMNIGSLITGAQLSWLAFVTIGLIAAFYSILMGCLSTADSISREKRGETLGLLLLTRLTPVDVVLARLFPTLLGVGGHILALLPVPALTLMLGGVGPGDVALLLGGCLNLLLFSASAGIFSSALTREAPRAVILALVSALAPLAIWLLGPFLDHLPTFARMTGLVTSRQIGSTTFLLLHSFVFAGSALFILCASLWIRFEVKGFPGKSAFIQRFFNSSKEIDPLDFKCPELPVWFEDPNPLLRAFFHRRNRSADTLAAAIASIASVLLTLASSKTEFKDMVFISCAVVGLGFLWLKLLFGLRARRDFTEDLESGAFELLLASPADPEAIVRGKLMLLKREAYRSFIYLSVPLGIVMFMSLFFSAGTGQVVGVATSLAGALGCLLFLCCQALEVHSITLMGASTAMGGGIYGGRVFAVAFAALWHVLSQILSVGLVCFVLQGELLLQSLSCLGLILLLPPTLLLSIKSQLIAERVLTDDLRAVASGDLGCGINGRSGLPIRPMIKDLAK